MNFVVMCENDIVYFTDGVMCFIGIFPSISME